jgi:hypothetical protein
MADIPTSNILLCDEYNYNVVNVHNNAHSYGRFFKNFHQQSTITRTLLIAAARCCCELLRATVSCFMQAAALLRCFAASLLRCLLKKNYRFSKNVHKQTTISRCSLLAARC